jgi:S1-C subfamily serine protease
MKNFFIIIFLTFTLTGCYTTGTSTSSNSSWKYPWPKGLNKTAFIEKYFTGRELDKIEGVYVGSNNKYEIAVIKNTFGIQPGYDYLGILTDENAMLYRVGDIKLRLKKTATSTLLTGDWYMGDKSRMGRTFIFKDGYFQIDLPTGYYGASQTWMNIKTYPSVLTASKKTTSSKSKKSSASSGTAFFISNNYLITNHHVIKDCNDRSKIMYNNKEVDAKVLAKDSFLDLALLKVDLNNDSYIQISEKPPSKLQRIIAAGYPFGKYLSDDIKFTSGIISSLKGLGDDSTRLQIDAALNRGSSGGPIVDEQNGNLVAVAVSGLSKSKTESVNFGIKSASVKNFLESNQITTDFSKNKYSSRADVAELLENSTMYTFCK